MTADIASLPGHKDFDGGTLPRHSIVPNKYTSHSLTKLKKLIIVMVYNLTLRPLQDQRYLLLSAL
jgi:hypothetical protein